MLDRPHIAIFGSCVIALMPCLHSQIQAAAPAGNSTATRNAAASEGECPQPAQPRSGGLTNIAPDDLGTTARIRECTVLKGTRNTAQVGRTIEVLDDAAGPASGPDKSTAASASYALSLVNVRPGWPAASRTGEANALSLFTRQATGDTAAILANVGVRKGFAATLESLTFAADSQGKPFRAVRTQLGVVNPRDGGEFGLLVQAAEGQRLAAGLRIASLGSATWENYLEAISPSGKSVAVIRGVDGAIVAGDLLPVADLQKTVGSPDLRYAATYSEVLHLTPAPLARLPKCGGGSGGGTLAYVSDARSKPTAWGQVVTGGGKVQVFAKCDGNAWTAF